MSQFTHAAKDLNNDLRELGVKITDIGSVVDYGAFSVYLEKLSLFKNEKNLVLVITKDKYKFNFLNKIYRNHGISIEAFTEDNLSFEEMDIFYTLQAFGWQFFYVQKVESFDTFEQTPIIKSLMKVTENCRVVEITGAQLNVHSVIENIKDCALTNFDFSESNLTEEENEVLEAIKESLEVVKTVSKKDFFRLDLHEKQFIKHNGVLICIDPVEYI